MEILFELVIRGLIADFFGRYTRYYFFKLIGKEKPLAYFSAEKTKDNYKIISQHLSNVVVGTSVFILLSFLTVYVVYTYF